MEGQRSERPGTRARRTQGIQGTRARRLPGEIGTLSTCQLQYQTPHNKIADRMYANGAAGDRLYERNGPGAVHPWDFPWAHTSVGAHTQFASVTSRETTAVRSI